MFVGLSGGGRGNSTQLTSREREAQGWRQAFLLGTCISCVCPGKCACPGQGLGAASCIPTLPEHWTASGKEASPHRSRIRGPFAARLIQSPVICLASLTFVGID